MMYYLFGLVNNLFKFLNFLLVIYALLSWFPGAYQTKLGIWVRQIVELLLSPFRKLRLQFGGLDFTIIVVLLLMNYLRSIIIRLLFLLW